MLAQVEDDAFVSKVNTAVEAADMNAVQLARIADRLAARLNINAQEQGQ
jgi:hypothetical protein